LNVFPLHVPPLRERPDDILPLAYHILQNRRLRLAPSAERLLRAYDWPGNVRELRNAMERAAVLAHGSLILPHDLPPQLQTEATPSPTGGVLVGNMEEIQRRAILLKKPTATRPRRPHFWASAGAISYTNFGITGCNCAVSEIQ